MGGHFPYDIVVEKKEGYPTTLVLLVRRHAYLYQA